MFSIFTVGILKAFSRFFLVRVVVIHIYKSRYIIYNILLRDTFINGNHIDFFVNIRIRIIKLLSSKFQLATLF